MNKWTTDLQKRCEFSKDGQSFQQAALEQLNTHMQRREDTSTAHTNIQKLTQVDHKPKTIKLGENT